MSQSQPQMPGSGKGTRVQSHAARTVKSSRGTNPPPGPRKTASKARPRPWRTPLAIMGVLALGGAAAFGGVLYKQLNKISNGGGIRPTFDAVINPRKEFPGKNRINVLLIGKDYSYLQHMKDKKLNGARHTKDSRSDSIVVLSLDLENKKVSALSIPRDLWVEAPDGKIGKINATYPRGNQDGGPGGGAKLLAGTIGKVLGVTPDYYVAVQSESIKNIVNELGGVEVETIDAMRYDDSQAGLHINLPKGRQTINGDAAIGFARFREPDVFVRDEKGNPVYTGRKDRDGNPIFVQKRRSEIAHSKEEGDPRRMARQRQLMAAMVAKGKSFGNFTQIGDIVDGALDELETSLSRPQIIALASLFRETPSDQIQSAALATRGVMRQTVYGRSFTYEVDERKKEALVNWLLKGDEQAANRLTVVSVENTTGINGAARRVADLLQEKGFTAHAANAGKEGEAPATRIVYGKAMFAPRAQTIAQIIGGGTLVKEVAPEAGPTMDNTDDEPDVTVVLGRDLALQFAQRSARR